MIHLYDRIKENPEFYKQLQCGDTLITLFNCLLTNKHESLWSQHNYIVYVVDGRKIWHTPTASYDLKKGDCVFVKKGASIVEQFFDVSSCFILFFMPDEFIADTVQGQILPEYDETKTQDAIIKIEDDPIVTAFFNSMMSYFVSQLNPGEELLKLKFRELILTLSGISTNHTLRTYFSFLLKDPRSIDLKEVMEKNFCYNLKLEEYAKLSSRSLSAFKRDFENMYKMSPGKWLLEKRLKHAFYLLKHQSKTVGEAAFESGFENPSHFSRVFRKQFGTSPASVK